MLYIILSLGTGHTEEKENKKKLSKKKIKEVIGSRGFIDGKTYKKK